MRVGRDGEKRDVINFQDARRCAALVLLDEGELSTVISTAIDKAVYYLARCPPDMAASVDEVSIVLLWKSPAGFCGRL